MSKSVINFKVDSVRSKQKPKKLAIELGVPLSSIINAQLRELIRTRTLIVSTEPRMTSFLDKVIEIVERDRKSDKHITRNNSIEDAIAHLDSL